MSPRSRRFGLTFALLVLAGSGALFVRARLARQIDAALESPPASVKPLSFVPVAPARVAGRRVGSGEVTGVALTGAGLWVAGASGVAGGDLPVAQDGGLPTLRASALASWRGVPMIAAESGGIFRRHGGGWDEVRTGFGTLHVRALAESEAGELLIGAKEGLFRASWGGTTLARIDAHPVRSLAATRGALVAGGEEGLWHVDGSRAVAIETTDPWIESVGVVGELLYAATPAGLLRGPVAGPLQPVPGADDVASGVGDGEAFWGVAWPQAEVVRRVTPDGVREERLPAAVFRVMSASGVLFADTEAGLFRREPLGWRLARPRPEALPAGSAHMSALAFLGERLVAGTFDGGIAVAEAPGPAQWRTVPGSSAWGVNALLAAGGELYVASLRGAARFDGQRLLAIEGPGAAFALAATDEGVAIGYAQGVRLPGANLVSAFHGLPGNQVLALASSHELFVGTPSGLGALRGRRVAWRVAAGESKLPHPWVTALLEHEGALYVGTYGGGVARRVAREAGGPGSGLVDRASYEAFPETEGLKINAGCLLRAGGRLYAGTDGAGLWRTSEDGRRFERLAVALPSPRVTALLATEDTLHVGTDEGLASLALRELP
jgi:ligand-binding sensor domain-containing protein